ncbi:MAG: MaoC family dehydratase [Thiohalobacterales bacterium]|nr:MaoC family dehydratase [Thiohalobacterales bacterium]
MNGYYFEDLEIGQTASSGKTVTEADILLFAAVSGDVNPSHTNEEFARTTRMKTRVAHGMLTASLVSAVLGCELPGPGCLYVSQTTQFRAPVKPGDTVLASVTVARLLPEKNFVEFDTRCTVDEILVLEGTSLLWVPSRSA